MEAPKPPSHDALSAMPGDTISYQTPLNGIATAFVASAGWHPTPKGGKQWTYETDTGELVPNTMVVKVVKNTSPASSGKSESQAFTSDSKDFEKVTQLVHYQTLARSLEALSISAMTKTAIFCLLESDAKNLEIAHHLIGVRLKQLNELK